MRPSQHIRNAIAWQTKAPPFPFEQDRHTNIVRFPVERTRPPRQQ
jgi:hypothetical protein